MAYDEELAERIRVLLLPVPDVTERGMFGSLAFMVRGNIAVAPMGDGFIVRVPRDEYEALLNEEHASEMRFTGRPMRGFVHVDAAAFDDDPDLLADWVRRGVETALALPAKQ